MIRDILTFDNPLLREHSQEVKRFDEELWELLDDMYETMNNADGIGIAAPQIGVLKRVIVIDTGGQAGKIELINPIITAMWGKQEEAEGCLSLLHKRGIVCRPMHVRAKAYDRYGKLCRYHVKELLARAFCHETDHLNGVLYKDKVIEWVEDE
ncbi:MAG: peptide deformylase [Oscillospiraceae bacterium]|nr:peptide deformylase [Oscillospiraceae bacterium]